MKKIGFIVFLVALIAGCVLANFVNWGKGTTEFFQFSVGRGGEKGSGTTATEVRGLRGFTKVDTGGVFQVEIVVQSDFSVEVEADDNLLQYIKTDVSGGELEISLDKRVRSNNPLRVRIGMPNIEELEASGASKVWVKNVKNALLSVEASGASKVEISGETADLRADISGASQVNAAELRSVNANIDASGASRASVNVSGELRSEASGASSITYTGSPSNVIKNTSGGSSVVQN